MITEKENLITLEKRVEALQLSGYTLIAFDFDELVVPLHLTREVAQHFSKDIDESQVEKLGSSSFGGISYLNSLMDGVDASEYARTRDEIVKPIPFRGGFEEVLKELIKKYAVIFISSGLRDVCYAKLKEINFNPNNVIGTELHIENNKITGSELIITNELKGVIVKKLREKYFVISVGHSFGDKYLIQNANVGISYRSIVPGLAQHDAKTPEEILQLIEKALEIRFKP